MRETGLHGSVVGEYKRCGKPNCRCVRGKLHGPYYYRRWREADGRQRKEYVPRERVPEVELALAYARTHSPRAWQQRLRQLRALLDATDDQGRKARRALGDELGRHWHGRRLRERRRFSPETRNRSLYRLNRDAIIAAVGWHITEDDFVELQQMICSERKRRNRLSGPWRVGVGRTEHEELSLSLDLKRLPSYREHLQREHEGNGR